MCGITGIFDTRTKGVISGHTLWNMVTMLHHRGPDQKGLYRDELGKANQKLAAVSDEVYLLTAGIPLKLK